jgi:hypothetical protein
LAADYRPPPPPLVPSTPREAADRLAQLNADPEFRRRYLGGDLTARDEYNRLIELKAGLTPFDAVVDGGGDWSVGPGLDGPQLSRRDQISAAHGLREQGASDEEIQRIYINGEKYPAETVRDARYWLPLMQANPNLEIPGIPAVERERLVRFFGRVLAVGDGSEW